MVTFGRLDTPRSLTVAAAKLIPETTEAADDTRFCKIKNQRGTPTRCTSNRIYSSQLCIGECDMNINVHIYKSISKLTRKCCQIDMRSLCIKDGERGFAVKVAASHLTP